MWVATFTLLLLTTTNAQRSAAPAADTDQALSLASLGESLLPLIKEFRSYLVKYTREKTSEVWESIGLGDITDELYARPQIFDSIVSAVIDEILEVIDDVEATVDEVGEDLTGPVGTIFDRLEGTCDASGTAMHQLPVQTTQRQLQQSTTCGRAFCMGVLNFGFTGGVNIPIKAVDLTLAAGANLRIGLGDGTNGFQFWGAGVFRAALAAKITTRKARNKNFGNLQNALQASSYYTAWQDAQDELDDTEDEILNIKFLLGLLRNRSSLAQNFNPTPHRPPFLSKLNPPKFIASDNRNSFARRGVRAC